MWGMGYVADVFYPSDLYDEYKHVPVQAGNAKVTVSVNNYRNNANPPEKGGTQTAVAVKDGFINASKAKILGEAGGAVSFVDVFTGKASPKAISAVLGLVYKYRDDFIKQFEKTRDDKGDCARLLASTQDPQTMLQAFADAYIGLDCNGFVGNFAKRVKPNGGLGPQQGPKEYYTHRKATRNTFNDVVHLDVIVWEDFSHIAVIDTFDSTLQHVNIAQSTGGGPQITPHTLVSRGGGLFDISPPTKVAGPVYVISMGW